MKRIYKVILSTVFKSSRVCSLRFLPTYDDNEDLVNLLVYIFGNTGTYEVKQVTISLYSL